MSTSGTSGVSGSVSGNSGISSPSGYSGKLPENIQESGSSGVSSFVEDKTVGSGYCVDATGRVRIVIEDSISGSSGNSGFSGKCCCKPRSGYSSHSGCLDSFYKESGYSGRRKKRSLFRWFLDLFTK